MPAGKFDSPLPIANGCVSPSGPLDLAAGETAMRLDIWVWQDNVACAVQRVPVQGNRWTATVDPKTDHTGPMFQAGPATAMALLVSTTPAGTKTFQWTQG